MFWTPAFAGVTLQETFYEIIKSDPFINEQTFHELAVTHLAVGSFCSERGVATLEPGCDPWGKRLIPAPNGSPHPGRCDFLSRYLTKAAN